MKLSKDNYLFTTNLEIMDREEMRIVKIVGWCVLGIVVAIVAFASFYVVDAGYYGIKKTLGKVEQTSYAPGIGLKAPFITTVESFDCRTQKMSEKTACYTADLQTAELEYNLTYNVKGQNVHTLYSEVGMDYQSKKIIPLLNDVLKDVIGKWQAQELVANRDSARVQVNNALRAKIDNRFFENIDFAFNNIDYSDNFEKSIEAKVIAEQKAQEAVNNTRRIKEEAEQKLISAKAEAEAMEIKTRALQQNRALIEYEAIQKWDGKLPVYNMGGAMPMIQLPNGK